MSNLAHLASFHAVCQTLNISVAARTLGLSQPSLSRQLKRLEESLGLVLFVRRQRGIALTDEGARLAEAVAPVILALHERLDLLRSQATSARGRLRVGSLTEAGKTLLLPRLIAFARDFPDVEIELRLLRGDEILTALHAQELDFGVITSLPDTDQLRVTRLAEERTLLLTRGGNLRDVVSAGDALAARFVAYRHDDPLLGAFLREHFPTLSRRRIRPHFAVNDHRAMVDALTSLELYAVMPVHSVAGYLEAGTLRNASPYELRANLWLARPARARDTVITRGFANALART